MKKLIFCCLVVLMGACKDDKKDPEPETDYAPSFVGVYETTTVEGGITSRYKWDVTTEAKNQLNVKYTKNTEVKVSGTTISLTQEYPLVAVKTTAQDNFEVNEKVNVTQSTNQALNVRLSGIGSRIVNGSGVAQINITLKSSEASTGLPDEEVYLEFKKK
ncbi:hypothetical protein GCM10010967_42840 [Dyadobacter beijingensis]|uniref:Lipocalin-like domain-containing protein n=1 Tax=Dyadobacter beijingensis TaxID=365489 RepID=A0ABQ2I938_9BACT|nr:hypothetical protein [Dyadobacter beijingensis]GGN03475.1 hypothetical protein GCM10010967_42840 [Dyadobacter beijingensis]